MKHIHHYKSKEVANQNMPTLDDAEYRERMIECQQTIKRVIDEDNWRESPWCESFTEDFTEEVKRAAHFVDIGAELGFYTYLALKYMPTGGKITAFEPDPVSFELLEEFFRPYNNVKIYNYAVHDEAGQIELVKPRGQSATSADVMGETFTASTAVLDDLLGDEKIDVIKMDIEGAEARAFKGMRNIIARGEATIFLELHYWADEILPGGIKLMEELLAKGRYRKYISDNGGLVQTGRLKGDRLVLLPVKKYVSKNMVQVDNSSFHLQELVLDYTRVCNSKCTYCSIWKIKDAPELTVDEIEDVFRAPQMQSLKSCYVTGGEPYISDKIIDIAVLLKKHIPGCLLTGATNAIQAEKILNRILKIRDMGLEVHIQVSLNGTRSVHDATRGRTGNWDECITLIDKLLEYGITTITAFSVMPQTIRDLPYMRRFCDSRGIGMEIVWVRQSPRYLGVDSEFSTWHESLKPRLKMIEYLPDYFDCPAMDKRLVVTPNGEVYPCEIYTPELLLGNIKERSMEEILNDPRAGQIARMIKNRGCTWCQGTGEIEGNPKWMVMDCYRRQSPQACETVGNIPQALHAPPQISEQIISEALTPVLNARPESIEVNELGLIVKVNKARAHHKLVPV